MSKVKKDFEDLRLITERRRQRHAFSRGADVNLLLAVSIMQNQQERLVPSKRNVLGRIQQRGWAHFDPWMMEWQKGRVNSDRVWEIGFAYHVRDLREHGYIHPAKTHQNEWRLTNPGEAFCEELLNRARHASLEGAPLGIITGVFVREVLNKEAIEPGPEEGAEGLKGHRKHYRGEEGEWHSRVKALISQDPTVLQLGFRVGDVERVWVDQIEVNGVRLWKAPWVLKRPDVVFALRDGRLIVVEVEPISTVRYGVSQIVGDYIVEFRVDRLDTRDARNIRGVLVIDAAPTDIDASLLGFLREADVHVVRVP